MFRIDRHGIEMTRGDSARVLIRVKGRELPEGTQAVFTVKDTPWEPCSPVIEKVLDVVDDAVSLVLEPADTETLHPGHYVWDLRLKEPRDDGGQEVLTPMEYAAFKIVEAIGE